MDRKDAPATRRRGAELEEALLTAAYAELIERGYAGLTIEGVAERAGTSRHVIYRRWADREKLAMAALRFDATRSHRPAPDTGSLRGDLIATLQQVNETRAGAAAVFSLQLVAYFEGGGLTPAELRRELIGDRGTAMTVILDRAVARGEVDPARLTPRVRTVASDLFRHEMIMTLQPVPRKVIEEIVDEVFLPLVGVKAGPD